MEALGFHRGRAPYPKPYFIEKIRGWRVLRMWSVGGGGNIAEMGRMTGKGKQAAR